MLEIEITRLYKEVLKYLIESVLIRRKNCLLRAVRDTIKFDNWESKITAIKEIETQIKDSIAKYSDIKKGKPRILALQEKYYVHIKALGDANDIGDPEFDLEHVMEKKGGLLGSCCSWFFKLANFQKFISDTNPGVFWITGAAGKGKTMLMCDIIQDLQVCVPEGKV